MPGRNRTCDPLLRRQVLYPLSYGHENIAHYMLFLFGVQFRYTASMHLRQGEKTLKLFRHHPFPYAIRVFKISISSVPFYFLLYLLRTGMSGTAFLLSAFVITFLFLIVLVYDGFLYWLDRLVITNYRIVYINWPFFSMKNEFEAEIADIQDIETREQGIFSYFRIFDFGLFEVQTAASRVTITFRDAPDPEGIKHFVFSQAKQQ